MLKNLFFVIFLRVHLKDMDQFVLDVNHAYRILKPILRKRYGPSQVSNISFPSSLSVYLFVSFKNSHDMFFIIFLFLQATEPRMIVMESSDDDDEDDAQNPGNGPPGNGPPGNGPPGPPGPPAPPGAGAQPITSV